MGVLVALSGDVESFCVIVALPVLEIQIKKGLQEPKRGCLSVPWRFAHKGKT